LIGGDRRPERLIEAPKAQVARKIAPATGSRRRAATGIRSCGRNDASSPGARVTVSRLSTISSAHTPSTPTRSRYASVRGAGPYSASAPEPRAPIVRPVIGDAVVTALASEPPEVVGTHGRAPAARR
jgi:hypothetical protein